MEKDLDARSFVAIRMANNMVYFGQVGYLHEDQIY
jgi:hypothetical protein